MTRRHEQSPAFSLIELLVVIAIIGLIVGLVIVGVAKMRESAQSSQTRAILAGLSGVAADYEVATQTPISHVGSAVFNWSDQKRKNVPGETGSAQIATNSNDPEQIANVFSERFVWAAQKHPNSAAGVARVGEGNLVDLDDDGFLEIRDAWGNSIAYAAYNFRNSGEDFLPHRDAPFFASPGPDGRWGRPRLRNEFDDDAEWESYLQTSGYAQSRDNLYSFDLDQSAGTLGN